MIPLSLPLKVKIKALAALSLFTVVVMLFVSNDSQLGSVNNHVDSAIFFMSGKAWANGLVPYVDFSDSKGPLLWLIEMVGYWISPTDYHGVWILSVVMMTFTFYFCWKTAMAVLHRPWLSMCVAVTMALVYFLGFDFLETRAETWCNLPVIYVIYLVVKKIVADRPLRRLQPLEALMLGVAFMACLLVKWSIAVMMLSLCGALLLLTWKSGLVSVVKAIGWFVAGCALLAAPFAVYLCCVGAFRPFVEEYFSATSASVGLGEHMDYVGFYLNQARRIYHSPVSVVTVILGLAGGYMLFRKHGWEKWLLPLCYCVFFAIGSYKNWWLYYLQASMSFSVLGIICMAEKLGGVNDLKSIYYVVFAALAAIYFHSLYPVYRGDDTYSLDVDEIDRAVAMHLDGKQSHPMLLCYRCLDSGVGIGHNAMPATKYWFLQNGATATMVENQDDALKSRRADIILSRNPEHDSLIVSHGYTKVYSDYSTRNRDMSVDVYVKAPTP